MKYLYLSNMHTPLTLFLGYRVFINAARLKQRIRQKQIKSIRLSYPILTVSPSLSG